MEENNNIVPGLIVVLVIVFLAAGGIGGCMYGYPQYNVYSSRLSGEAQLAEAEAARQVTVRQAQADKDAAKLKAEAEILRAEGAARANEILMDKLGGPEGYLRYLYIQHLEDRVGDTIYIPTEAGLPILEARPK